MANKVTPTRPVDTVAYAQLRERAKAESDPQRDHELLESLRKLWRSEVSVQYILLSLGDEADALAVLRIEQRGLIQIEDISEYVADEFSLRLVVTPTFPAFLLKLWEA